MEPVERLIRTWMASSRDDEIEEMVLGMPPELTFLSMPTETKRRDFSGPNQFDRRCERPRGISHIRGRRVANERYRPRV